MQPRNLVLLLLAYLALRWALGVDPGYTYDVQAYKRWMLAASTYGIARVYETSDCDYPPLYVYYLYPLGKVYAAVRPPAGGDPATADGAARLEFSDGPLLTFLVKLPPLLMDLALASLLFGLARRVGTRWTPTPGHKGGGARAPTRTAPVRASATPGLVVAGLYLANPAVLFDGGYWGQPDSIHSFFVLAAFVTLGGRRAWPAWVLLTLATLMKPLGAPFFPLLGILSLAWHGWRGSLAGGASAAATAALVFLPFMLAGQMGTTFDRVVGDVGAMPFTSVNAHNLWWALGGWRDADVPWIGPFSLTHLSMALFGVLYAGVLVRAHRLHRAARSLGIGTVSQPQALALVFLIALGFFMLSTHMHENHLFMAIPLLAPLLLVGGSWQRRMRVLFVALSFAVLANMVLHDLTIPERPPFIWGGPSGVENIHLKRPFFVAELAAIRVSTGLNLVLFGLVIWWTFRPGWLESMAGLPGLRTLPPRE